MFEKIIEFINDCINDCINDYIKHLHIGPFTDGPYNRDYYE